MKTTSMGKGPTRRRALASALTAGPAVAMAMAQQPAAAGDLDAAAREAVKRTSATLRKLKVPIATEPAFAFRA